ncbi:EAL domain-containing protein [Deinococcus depolymerans]|uniref:EAL domain-containing protein n=1 Tax=Deinococcus depolymerans TaxID=392408 RepID=A0ABN1BNP6_9DEIO
MDAALTPTDQAVLTALTDTVDPLLIVDSVSGEVLLASEAFAQWSGYPRAQLTGFRTVDLLASQDRERFRRSLQVFLHGNMPSARRDFMFQSARGGPLPAQVRGLRFTLAGGRRVGVLAIRPATELLPAALFYRQILEELPLALSVLDPEGRYLYLNPAAAPDPEERASLTGLTEREAAARLGLDGDTVQLREAATARAQRDPERLSWEETAAGQLQQRTLVPILNEQGSLNLMLSFATDLPERLRQSERLTLLEGSMQAAVLPMCILDARPGDQRGRLVYANVALERLLSPLTVSLGTHPLEWPWAPADRRVIRALLTELNSTAVTSFTRDLNLTGRDEWWEVTATRVGQDLPGGGSHWALFLRDVREQRRAELFLRSFADATVTSLQDAPLDAVLDAMFRGLGEVLNGWSPGVATLDSPIMRVMGPVPAPLRRALDTYPSEWARALWSRRDANRSGRALVIRRQWARVPVGQEVQGQWVPAVQTSVEVPMYDRARQLLGLLVLTHPEPLEVSPDLLRLAENMAGHIALLIDRQRTLEQLEQLAYTDALTGLTNRGGFTRQAAQLLSGGEPLALALMDLNRFKVVNDTLGHDVGDELLRAISARLDQVLRAWPVPVLARMGGDEFALMLRNPALIGPVSETIRAAMAQPFEVAGRRLRVGIAVGWSVYPHTAPDSAALLRQADMAMYLAKRGGEGHAVFTPVTQPRIAHLTLESALYEALRGGQFTLVFQPQVRVVDRGLIGAEVLVRWTHPDLGVISPAEFIPLAEATGLIDGIGAFVLRAALSEALTWPAPLRLSVNVSPVQLRHPQFTGRLAALLAETGFDPARLTLEVTETAFINDLSAVTGAVRALRALGVRVTVDDFGTGYSTLMTLRDLLAHELKIDRAFVRELCAPGRKGSQNRAIVQATLGLAQALGLQVVAEGVETQAQADLLAELGCPVMQGYLIAPGLDAETFRQQFLNART